MLILVKKHRIHESGAEAQTSESFVDFDTALAKFFKYSSDYINDTTVEKFDITILNETLVPCKTEHFTRVYPEPEPEPEQMNEE